MNETLKAILTIYVICNAVAASFTYFFVLLWMANLDEKIKKLEGKR